MPSKIKVIIVDDSAPIRELFSSILSSDPDVEVVATAPDPYDAREKIKRLNPDVITLDVEMPKMDGISFLEKIMTLRPMPVIMVSTLTTREADTTLKALELGAIDYIAKPEIMDGDSLAGFREELLYKVKQAALSKPGLKTPANKSDMLTFSGGNTGQLIAIGASAGGVEAIRELLLRLPANTPAMVITQHMPDVFTKSFADRLDTLCAMTIHEATHNQLIEPGNVYIAAGNRHLEVRAQGSHLLCFLTQESLVSGHRPSVDVLFESVAQIPHKKLIGAILTGMGHDGAAGLLKLRKAGAVTLGQNEASCTVYGMPRAAKMAGAVEHEISLADMPREILKACKG